MNVSEQLQAKMELAVADLERQLTAADRVMIGTPRWSPTEADPDRWELVVDSVPVSVVKILGRDRVAQLYQDELRAMDPEQRATRGLT